jgi:beta-xylosidase
MRDENGKLHIIWKEDGNSKGKPTPIWMQELNEARTAVIGEKKELFRNDTPWEGNLVEGVSMLRHGNYIYAFYAAAGCCGTGCTYQSGVARATKLAGPWLKDPSNPVLKNEGVWQCPGHGTPVEKDGRFYLLYHAYDTAGTVFTGRQGLLREFVFTPDNWIQFKRDTMSKGLVIQEEKDEFSGSILQKPWQWSTNEPVKYRLQAGKLFLNAGGASRAAFLGRKTMTTHYRASIKLDRKRSTAASGMALVGDDQNRVAAYIIGNTVELIKTKAGKDSLFLSIPIPRHRMASLVMEVRNGKDISFYLGHKRNRLQKLNIVSIDGAFLPPWDRAPRVGLIVKGAAEQKGVFDHFEMIPLPL